MSTLTKNQKKRFTATFHDASNRECVIVAKVRHDDECGNGHNSFGITAEIYTPDRIPGETNIQHNGKTLWLSSCGCHHDEVAQYFPDLAPLIKWHLCSTDGPMHYIANTVYMAGERDHNGLLKGELRQFMDKATGLPEWKLDIPYEYHGVFLGTNGKAVVASVEKPAPVIFNYVPYGTVGEGKERELPAARVAAVWPEATDEELTSPGLEQRLKDRLPALMVEFQKAVESLGFTY